MRSGTLADARTGERGAADGAPLRPPLLGAGHARGRATGGEAESGVDARWTL